MADLLADNMGSKKSLQPTRHANQAKEFLLQRSFFNGKMTRKPKQRYLDVIRFAGDDGLLHKPHELGLLVKFDIGIGKHNIKIYQ